MNIEIGDTIRLKQSLKLNEQYDGLTFADTMDYRPNRVTICAVDDDTVLAKGQDNYTFWYSLSMLDIRTLRKAKKRFK